MGQTGNRKVSHWDIMGTLLMPSNMGQEHKALELQKHCVLQTLIYYNTQNQQGICHHSSCTSTGKSHPRRGITHWWLWTTTTQTSSSNTSANSNNINAELGWKNKYSHLPDWTQTTKGGGHPTYQSTHLLNQALARQQVPPGRLLHHPRNHHPLSSHTLHKLTTKRHWTMINPLTTHKQNAKQELFPKNVSMLLWNKIPLHPTPQIPIRWNLVVLSWTKTQE